MSATVKLHPMLELTNSLLLASNYPQAELTLRKYLRQTENIPRAHQLIADRLMAHVIRGYGLESGFTLSEKRAKLTNPQSRYLLIKAWGYGFWSDVHHVLGQLLIAELTGRTPIVHWGENSLFRDVTSESRTTSNSNGLKYTPDVFELYFVPISAVRLPDLPEDISIYPPKWTRDSLCRDNINKWQGPYSRLSAPFFFKRDEDLLVSDFYATVSSIIPWIDPDSEYYGMTDDQIYAALFERHLRPTPALLERVESFHRLNLLGRNWVAVHARGSDKILESATLHQTNLRYYDFIDRIIELNPGIGIFLLTDTIELHAQMSERYQKRLVSAPALRSAGSIGVHMQGHPGRRVGEEVMVDALLATRCDYFLGNQESNVSLAISSMKRWPCGQLILLGNRSCRAENLYLHRQEESVQSASLCRQCELPMQLQLSQQVIGIDTTHYYRCLGCDALQTEEPRRLKQPHPHLETHL